MTAAFTVILPHKRNPGNDRALAIALECLTANTHSDFILMMDAAFDAPLYERVNRMVMCAPTDICVYTASDMFFAPGWDTPMLDAFTHDTFVTNVVVEPRAIAMHPLNLEHDFGRKPETFRRDAFEAWCASAPVPSGEGWYAPFMFSASRYLQLNGLDETMPDFSEVDIDLFERHKKSGGKVVRARSFVYHLQRWSDIGEQIAEKRR